MKAFPMFIRTSGRRVVIVGGDEEAAQKTRLIQKTDARIEIIAPKLDAELAGLVRSDRATHIQGHVGPEDFRGSALTFVATGCAGADAAFHALAKEGGALVNVVDRPELCDATTPSIVDRDPVVVAIGTEGTAPVLARKIKTEVETMLPPRLGSFAALLGQLRGAIAQNIAPKQRRAFWAWIINDAPARLHREGAEDEAARLLKTAISERSVPNGAGEGHIALVGAGPGSRDLLTMRAVKRLQEADIIFYDRLVDEEALEITRRDAERVFVGKIVGHHATTQESISRLIVAQAKKGRRVVRLKAGDPSFLGSATEDLQAAKALGIPVEIVPGVTGAGKADAMTPIALSA